MQDRRSESSISIRRIQQSYPGVSVYISVNTVWQETTGWDFFCFSFQIWTQQGEKKWDVLTWPWVYTDTTPWLCSTCTHKKLFKASLPLSSFFKAQSRPSIIKSHPISQLSQLWAGGQAGDLLGSFPTWTALRFHGLIKNKDRLVFFNR